MAEAELLKRLTGRRICSSCGATYHVVFDPPKQDGVCDRCDGSLYQQDDDREETVAKRLEVNLGKTRELVDYYQLGNLRRIDGAQPIDKVTESILKVLRGAIR